jgi:hypothetical protein
MVERFMVYLKVVKERRFFQISSLRGWKRMVVSGEPEARGIEEVEIVGCEAGWLGIRYFIFLISRPVSGCFLFPDWGFGG